MSRCIAISGKSGCGNTSVSTLLAQKLKFQLVNYTMRDLADERGVSLTELLNRTTSESGLDRELDQRQVRLAGERDSIVGSRLAMWNLRDTDAFTVYLRAPVELRSNRIAAREMKSVEQALQETTTRDARDRQRFLDLYDIDIDQYDWADLVVDVGALTVEEIAGQVLEAWGGVRSLRYPPDEMGLAVLQLFGDGVTMTVYRREVQGEVSYYLDKRDMDDGEDDPPLKNAYAPSPTWEGALTNWVPRRVWRSFLRLERVHSSIRQEFLALRRELLK